MSVQRQGVPALGGGGGGGGKLGWVGPSYPRWKILTKLEAKLLYDLIMSVTMDILSSSAEIRTTRVSSRFNLC